MTDSPTDLDEAYKSIESGRHKQIRSVTTGKWEVLIEGSYLESIVSELVAARGRIADLEAKAKEERDRRVEIHIERNQLLDKLFSLEKGEFWQAINRIGAIPDEVKDQIICDLESKLAKAIIPQAGDADILKGALNWIDSTCFRDEDVPDVLAELLKRYLTVIEGGKP